MAKITNTDYNFTYPIVNNTIIPELKILANNEIDNCGNTIEKAKNIIGYAHNMFSHDGDNVPSSSDPLTIFKEAKAGKSFRCVEYATLATGLLWAYGIPARTIGLKTRDVETRDYGAGHVVIEFWDSQHNRWVMSDVQAGIIAMCENTAFSALRLKQAIASHKKINLVPVNNSGFHDGKYGDFPNYIDLIKEYLYFIDTPETLTLGNENKKEIKIVMLVPDGVKPPVFFQGMFKMNAIYTNNAEKFYAKPNFI